MKSNHATHLTGKNHHLVPGLVSVVIPCYNYAHYLTKCVASVLAQGVDVRVLIIDDASTDDSREVGETLASAHENVDFIHHVSNVGHIGTYNEGLLTWAEGEFCLLLSADDRLAEGALKRAIDVMRAYPTVGLVYGRPLEFTDDTDLPKLQRRFPAATYWPKERWLTKRFQEGVNVVSTPTAMVRTSAQRAVGGYNPALPHAADLEMWLRIALVADLAYIPNVQAYYRIHGASMSQQVYQNRVADADERRRVFESVVMDHRDLLKALGIDSTGPFRAIASEALWAVCRSYEKATVDDISIQGWIDLAAQAHPRVTELRSHRALLRRKKLGVPICHSTQLFVGTAAARRLANIVWWERWKRHGS